RREEFVVDGGASLGEGRTLEESVPLEGLGNLLDLSSLDQLSVAAHHRRLDVRDRMLAVEERDDVEQRPVQQHDRRRVAGGIAQRQAPPALVLDGKRLDTTEPGEKAR